MPPLRELELEEPLFAVVPLPEVVALLRVPLPELLIADCSEPRVMPPVLMLPLLVEVLREELLMVPPWALLVLWLPLLFT